MFKATIKDKKLFDKVQLLPGDFPDEITLEDDSFDAIIATRVFHFYPPEKLEKAATAIFKALKHGGLVFIYATSPYTSKNWKEYLPIYENKKKNGDLYPGYVSDISSYAATKPTNVPASIRLLDPDVLTRVFSNSGFEIKLAKFLDKKDCKNNQFIGMKSVGFIARKP